MALSIMLTGKIEHGGPIDWSIAGLPAEEEVAPDGTLQDLIDIAHADMLAEEWQEYFLDQEREFPR